MRIREEVLQHHGDLLQQTRQIQGLESAMQSIGASVSSLQDAIARAQHEVSTLLFSFVDLRVVWKPILTHARSRLQQIKSWSLDLTGIFLTELGDNIRNKSESVSCGGGYHHTHIAGIRS